MNTVNWDTYLFHCSGLANLMVRSRKAGELSETTKAYLRDLWIKETWGREKLEMIGNKYTTKGIMCETDSIELYERVAGKTYFKNNKQLTNEFVVGTPDLIKPDVVDIKTSWDLYTFSGVDENKATKDYYYQLLGYMWLTGTKSSTLAYCLVDTPEIMIADELYRLSFKLPDDKVDQYRNNFVFDDIPEEMRVKSYVFERSEKDIEKLQYNIVLARDYLKEYVI